MGAENNLGPQFMSAHEILHGGWVAHTEEPDVHDEEFVPGRAEHERPVWQRKLSESQKISPGGAFSGMAKDGPSLHDDIGQHGVRDPVLLEPRERAHPFSPRVLDGQHRLISAFHHDPQMRVPVEWDK